jgi:hypothetical protein
MAIGADYVTRAEQKSYMGLEGTTDDTLVDAAISSASREIERHCNRQFNDAETASSRLYRATNCHTAVVDDFWTTTGLIVEINVSGDGVTWETVAATEYELTPLNRMSNGVEWVYWRINMVGTATFPINRRASLRVTARWGWEAIPADVKQAVKMLASDTFQIKDSRMGVAGSDQFGTIVRVRSNSLVEAKLKHFVRRKVLVR